METTTIALDGLTTGQAAVVGGFLGTVLTVSIIMGVLLLIAGWKIFEKAGEKGWKILIPIYDVYILFKICGIKNWFWALFCVSIITSIMMFANMPEFEYVEDWTGYHISNLEVIDWTQYPVYIAGITISSLVSIFATIVLAYKLAKVFGKGIGYTLGIIFFPNIFTLILGFGKAKYSAKNLKK